MEKLQHPMTYEEQNLVLERPNFCLGFLTSLMGRPKIGMGEAHTAIGKGKLYMGDCEMLMGEGAGVIGIGFYATTR